MTSATERYETRFATLADGGQLAYQVHGQAHRELPVLLVRPLGGSMALWGAFRQTLAEQRCVLSFDHRGSGLSSDDPGWPTTRSLAADSLALLNHLDVARAHVFGISLGGMTATWLAINEPARVATLCLASTPLRGVDVSRAGLRRGLGMAACLAKPDVDVEAALVERVLSGTFRRERPDEVRRIEATVREHPASRMSLLKHARAGASHDASHEIGRIRAPTLVLAGNHDALLGTSPSRAVASAIGGARFEIIAPSGHDLTLEQPLVTATRVAQFFQTDGDALLIRRRSPG